MFIRVFPRLVFVSLVFMLAGTLTSITAQDLRQKPPAPSRIIAPIDDSVRITVPRSTHPLAQRAFDIGVLEESVALKRMILVMGASPDQEQQLLTFLEGQQTKGSPDYHHWLTPEEFGARFGPSAQDIQQVTGWLQRQGFSVDSVARSGRWLEFSGTSRQVRGAFQTQMHQY